MFVHELVDFNADPSLKAEMNNAGEDLKTNYMFPLISTQERWNLQNQLLTIFLQYTDVLDICKIGIIQHERSYKSEHLAIFGIK